MRYTVYKICCKDTNVTDCYVGSTKNLADRIKTHKSKCNDLESTKHNFRIYQFIRENGGFCNWVFVPLELVISDNKQDAYRAETYWIRNSNATLNSYKPPTGLEPKERDKQYDKHYRIENKQKLIEYTKEYYIENKDKINQKFNCECGGKYTNANKTNHLKTNKHIEFLAN